MNFRKTNATTRRCTFPGCETPSDRIRDLKFFERVKALKMKKIYFPKRARVCWNHCSENTWNIEEESMAFSQKQIEDLIALTFEMGGKFEERPTAVGYGNTKTMKTYIGLNSDQFERIFNIVEASLLATYKHPDKAKTALYMYLMKLRTNFTMDEMAPLFNINRRIVMSRIRIVRQVMYRDFMPLHLFNYSRQDLIQHTSALSRRLYKVNDETVVLTLDGTYIYTIISSNYHFQKETYSMQKKRNLVKYMMCVTTDGLIVGAYGPFSARKNDASILIEISNEMGNFFDLLRPGDVVVLDRGFRDCVKILQNRGLIVKIPAFVGRKSQLTTKQANVTRNATKTRFVVEVRNGHVKRQWKMWKTVQIYQSIPYLKQDFEISAALVNAFSANVLSDKNDWNHVADTMISKANKNNNMMRFVRKIPKKSFNTVNNLTLLPKMTYAELKNISQGSYQINQAKSYTQMYLKANNNNFSIDVCDTAAFKTHCAQLGQYSKPLLLKLSLPSRFTSKKTHQSYVLLNIQGNGGYTVEKFCCTCLSGKRTVGCCSHIMTIIWYTVHVDQDDLRLPSTNFNNIFQRE